MQNILFILAFVCVSTSFAQPTNLVSNPSFESSASYCGITGGGVSHGWENNGGSPDLYFTNISTSCFNYVPVSGNTYPGPIGLKGDELPRSGNTMAGFGVYSITGFNRREYIKNTLSSPMVVGKTYIIEFYVSHGDSVEFFINRFGIHLSDSPIPFSSGSTNNVLNVTPQITASVNQLNKSTGWTRIADTIVATAAYRYYYICTSVPRNTTNTDSTRTFDFIALALLL